MEEEDPFLWDLPSEGEKKIVVLGEKSCGKTCLIASFVSECPVDMSQPVPNQIRKTIDFGRESVPVFLREEPVGPQYGYFRRLNFLGTSVALVCFAFNDEESIRSVRKWVVEVKHFCPQAHLYVVGCKLDLQHKTAVCVDEWRAFERFLLPYKYLECSAKTGEGVSHLVRVVGNALLDQQIVEQGKASGAQK